MTTTTQDAEILRRALSAAAERETAATRALQAAQAEWTAARKAYREARSAFDAAAYAREFERTHPPLFGGQDPGQSASESVPGRHEPDPDPEQNAYDVCRKCGRAIQEAPELGAWVTTVSRNPECYGRRS